MRGNNGKVEIAAEKRRYLVESVSDDVTPRNLITVALSNRLLRKGIALWPGIGERLIGLLRD